MTRDQVKLQIIHSKSYHITKEEAQLIWSEKDITKKEHAVKILNKLKFKNNYVSELCKMTTKQVDSLIANLIMAQELNKVIK